MKPHISYIVTTFDRPDHLACCLYSLKAQTDQSFEILVTDNSEKGIMKKVVDEIKDDRIRYFNPKKQECYESSNHTAQFAEGEFLCFPSEDSYYVPLFAELMYHPEYDLVYCDMLYDRRLLGKYTILHVSPVVNRIDKTGFIVKRDKFSGFLLHDLVRADGIFVQSLVKSGAKHTKINEALIVHN
jgi:glycosyltransferase involved in cell wall biosynthesis